MRDLINVVEGAATGITDAWFADGFQTYKRPAKERYEIATAPGTVQTLEGPVAHPAGFYIMTGPKGERYPISPDRFRDLKDDLGDGVAQPKKIVKTAKLADHNGFVTVDYGQGPQKLHYTAGNDYIVRHGPGDYGVVKKDIFAQTYAT